MIRISSSEENKFIIYSETNFNFSLFERNPKTGEFEVKQPLIQYSNLAFTGHYFEMFKKKEQSSEKEIVILLYKKEETASGRRLQEEAQEGTDNMIRIYYGTEPVCDLCPSKGNGFLIAGIVLSVLCLGLLIFGLVCGVRKLCKKLEKKPKKKKKVDYQISEENPVKFEIESERGNETVSDVFQTNENYNYQVKPNPNIAFQKEMIPAGREKEELSISK